MALERMSRYESTPSWISSPLTPAKKESLRIEKEQSGSAAMQRSAKKLDMYLGQSMAHKPGALDPSRLLTDPRVQDLAALTGKRVSLPKTVHDRAVPKVNMLRFQRHTSYLDAIPSEGGRVTGADTLMDNWVEDRHDAGHIPGWHPKELRLNRLWDTEHTANFVNTHDAAYAARMRSAYGVARPPAEPGRTSSSLVTASTHGTLLYGKQGFGDQAQQDHTSPPKRGGHWLGISPSHWGESVTTTAHGRSEHLEFQMRSATNDPRAKFLGSLPNTPAFSRPPDKWTEKAFADLHKSQLWTDTWRSIYTRDYGVGEPPATFDSLRGRGPVTGTVPRSSTAASITSRSAVQTSPRPATSKS
ncbi:hypothetical protein V8C86DRAFT_2667892 [Haematococcus lacustris]